MRLLLTAAILVTLSPPAWAQFTLGLANMLTPLPASPGLAVSDAATENNTDIAATSLSTGGGGGHYASASGFFAEQDQSLFSGVTKDSFGVDALFPGWEPCKPDCTTPNETIVATDLETYQSAIAVAQAQMAELEGEDFSALAANDISPDVLTVLQAILDAVLVNNAEQQYQRQLLATLILVQATRNATDLNYFAQDRANSATTALPLLANH